MTACFLLPIQWCNEEIYHCTEWSQEIPSIYMYLPKTPPKQAAPDFTAVLPLYTCQHPNSIPSKQRMERMNMKPPQTKPIYPVWLATVAWPWTSPASSFTVSCLHWHLLLSPLSPNLYTEGISSLSPEFQPLLRCPPLPSKTPSPPCQHKTPHAARGQPHSWHTNCWTGDSSQVCLMKLKLRTVAMMLVMMARRGLRTAEDSRGWGSCEAWRNLLACLCTHTPQCNSTLWAVSQTCHGVSQHNNIGIVPKYSHYKKTRILHFRLEAAWFCRSWECCLLLSRNWKTCSWRLQLRPVQTDLTTCRTKATPHIKHHCAVCCQQGRLERSLIHQ